MAGSNIRQPAGAGVRAAAGAGTGTSVRAGTGTGTGAGMVQTVKSTRNPLVDKAPTTQRLTGRQADAFEERPRRSRMPVLANVTVTAKPEPIRTSSTPVANGPLPLRPEPKQK